MGSPTLKPVFPNIDAINNCKVKTVQSRVNPVYVEMLSVAVLYRAQCRFNTTF